MIARSHVITIYRRGNGGLTQFRRRKPGWTAVASDVECNIQPRTGTRREGEEGVVALKQSQAFIPAGISIRTDDRVLVNSGIGPRRFVVADVSEHGARWDTECDLQETTEQFP